MLPPEKTTALVLLVQTLQIMTVLHQKQRRYKWRDVISATVFPGGGPGGRFGR